MTPIRVVRHISPGAFRIRAESWLLGHEAENNLVLGLAAQLETSMTGYEPPIYFATLERDGEDSRLRIPHSAVQSGDYAAPHGGSGAADIGCGGNVCLTARCAGSGSRSDGGGTSLERPAA